MVQQATQMNNLRPWEWKTSSQKVKGIKCDVKFCIRTVATQRQMPNLIKDMEQEGLKRAFEHPVTAQPVIFLLSVV